MLRMLRKWSLPQVSDLVNRHEWAIGGIHVKKTSTERTEIIQPHLRMEGEAINDHPRVMRA